MLAAFGLPHLFVVIKFTDVVWYFTLCCAVLFIELLFSVLQEQFICECILHVRQNPPLKNYRRVIVFKNSLCYIKGSNFTFLFFISYFSFFYLFTVYYLSEIVV